ncbi:transporter substrate-binding domain-containing protein [Crassaminicella profunda]|nr:transporter substrate-binding domain-containing protein [Crassaminicella profunda]
MINMIKIKGKKTLAIMLMICMVFAFTGCAKEKSSADNAPLTKIEEIKKAGKIVLGTSADYPPYEFHKEIDGKDTIVGFEIEMAKALAEELGVELEIKDIKFDGLLAALAADKIDLIIAGMTPTEERKQSVDFSKEYFVDEHKVLIKSKDAEKIKTADDLKNLKIGAQKASIQEGIAQGIEGADLKLISKITDLVLEISNDKIDAVILGKATAQAYADRNEELFVPEFSLGGGNGSAIAVKKGNEDFVKELNNIIDQLKKEGKIDQFIENATQLANEE